MIYYDLKFNPRILLTNSRGCCVGRRKKKRIKGEETVAQLLLLAKDSRAAMMPVARCAQVCNTSSQPPTSLTARRQTHLSARFCAWSAPPWSSRLTQAAASQLRVHVREASADCVLTLPEPCRTNTCLSFLILC